ncbi:MAG: AAA family ATPase [Candidatus Dojkabacteria bacterium]|nr:AAA family ATPase [Candidatus Dojkabacteria bacterium]
MRLDPKGGFLISGPAGSGKTTLALHRLAYLIQSPEFTEYFKAEDIIVFVSDNSAIKYFSTLLLDLGIKTAKVLTFLEWSLAVVNQNFNKRYKALTKDQALSILNYEMEVGTNLNPEIIFNEIRKYKLEALKNIGKENVGLDRLFNIYNSFQSKSPFLKIFKSFINNQQEDYWLDDIDTALLCKNTEVHKRVYSHIVVDEVQNWLPMQLDIIKIITDVKFDSVTYVGDINQRTKPFTIRSWNELEEGYPVDNEVTLTKAYRNTKSILSWLEKEDYDVNVDMVTEIGKAVIEMNFVNDKLKHEHITAELNKLVDTGYKGQVGVLSKYIEELDFSKNQNWPDNYHFLTSEDSQGMEFDTVFIANKNSFLDKNQFFELECDISKEEFTKVDRQLLFVAATRAKSELIILNS